jgi:hypothetical protein
MRKISGRWVIGDDEETRNVDRDDFHAHDTHLFKVLRFKIRRQSVILTHFNSVLKK